MEKLSFYSREDALSAAHELAIELNGSVDSNTVGVEVSAFECPEGLDSWSGETSAYVVRDNKSEPYAFIAFWD